VSPPETALRAAAAAQAATDYWEQRAQRFATRGEGLAAVCSYGMPDFYNRAIQCTQRRALAPWLRVPPGRRVLDLGCGVGRWSRQLAARGAFVTGVDLSPTMIEIARQRAMAAGLAARCRFLVQDLAQLQLGAHFDLIIAVTVLQHILEPLRLQAALAGIAAHLDTHGRILLLEAAPLRATSRCNSAVFTARSRAAYLRLFEQSGLRLRAIRGVDPAPFRTWLLPHLPRLPAALRLAGLATASALSLPLDALFAPRAARRSWHALFVLEHAEPSRRTAPLQAGAHAS
jgi:2-polyprenyl-3-methyl-5-hydroxy-6-metoxy-1,4-benzoquinol methylase